jgi:hypothetical protein
MSVEFGAVAFVVVAEFHWNTRPKSGEALCTGLHGALKQRMRKSPTVGSGPRTPLGRGAGPSGRTAVGVAVVAAGIASQQPGAAAAEPGLRPGLPPGAGECARAL